MHVQTLGSIRLRDEHTGAVILVPTPTQDPNDPLVRYSPPSPIKSQTHRNVELESRVQSFHHHPRLSGYFLVQFPRRRPSYRYRGDSHNFFPSPALSRCPRQYLEDGLLFHDHCFDAGCQQLFLDAGCQQVGSSSRVRRLIHRLYCLLDLGWCRYLLWVGTCLPYCDGFHGWLGGMFGSSHHLRSLVPSRTWFLHGVHLTH
jgi:hypothetical protein